MNTYPPATHLGIELGVYEDYTFKGYAIYTTNPDETRSQLGRVTYDPSYRCDTVITTEQGPKLDAIRAYCQANGLGLITQNPNAA